MNLRAVDDTHVGISINETTNLVDLDEIIEVFAELKQKPTSSSFLTQ
jgi:glycine cleavage system pyridoxal-binding protein P